MPGGRRRPLGAAAHEQSAESAGPAAERHRRRRGRVCLDRRRTPEPARTYGRNRAAWVTAAASVAAPEPIAEALDVPPCSGTCAIVWRPYVALKYAQTLDGRIASRTGDSKWISGDEERRISHALRATSDAVLVGVGTVLADDPRLTVRMVPGRRRVRVVLDSTLRVPRDARILEGDAGTMVISTRRAQADAARLQARGVAVHSVEPASGRRRPARRCGCSEALGVRSVLVEGGARVLTSFLEGETGRPCDRRDRADHPRGRERTRSATSTSSRSPTGSDHEPIVYRAGDDLLLAGDLCP